MGRETTEAADIALPSTSTGGTEAPPPTPVRSNIAVGFGGVDQRGRRANDSVQWISGYYNSFERPGCFGQPCGYYIDGKLVATVEPDATGTAHGSGIRN